MKSILDAWKSFSDICDLNTNNGDYYFLTGKTVQFYGRVYQLSQCDDFTRVGTYPWVALAFALIKTSRIRGQQKSDDFFYN